MRLLNSIIRTSVVSGLVVLMAQPVFASYVSILHNLIDGTPDTNYVGGVLTINQAGNSVTLNDPTPLGGAITNAAVSMSTNFASFNPLANAPYGQATFTGGSFLLSFDYNGNPYSIGGPITTMTMGVGSASPTLSIINGAGLFAAVANLPGSNDWPAVAMSSIHALTLRIGTDMTGFDWSTDWTMAGQTQYSLTPDESAVPEPASLLLLVLGLAVLRRSR
jgi:hypothetical protein